MLKKELSKDSAPDSGLGDKLRWPINLAAPINNGLVSWAKARELEERAGWPR